MTPLRATGVDSGSPRRAQAWRLWDCRFNDASFVGDPLLRRVYCSFFSRRLASAGDVVLSHRAQPAARVVLKEVSATAASVKVCVRVGGRPVRSYEAPWAARALSRLALSLERKRLEAADTTTDGGGGGGAWHAKIPLPAVRALRSLANMRLWCWAAACALLLSLWLASAEPDGEW